MAEKVIALAIQVRGTKEETTQLNKLQHSVDSVKKELARLRTQERDGVITAKEASAARQNLQLQLIANRNALNDLQASVLKNNDALRKNSGFVAGIKQGIQQAIPSFQQLAASFGLILGFGEVISFLKDSVEAFREAEKNAQQLSFALKNVRGEVDNINFDRLIRQSEELQKNGIFSDDSIQQVQTAAINFGLTAEQVEKLIPVVADFAAQTGQELSSAFDAVLRGIEGADKGLKLYTGSLELGEDRTKNLNIVTESLIKFQGANAAALQTSAGEAANMANKIDDLQEKIGSKLSPKLQGLQLSLLDTLDSFLDFSSALSEANFNIEKAAGIGAIREQVEKANKDVERFTRVYKDFTNEQLEAQKKFAEGELEKGRTSLQSIKEIIEVTGETNEELEKQKKLQLEANVLTESELRAIKILQKEKSKNAKENIDLTKLTLEELKALNTLASNDEIKRREKLFFDYKKLQSDILEEHRKHVSDIEELNKTSTQTTNDLIEEEKKKFIDTEAIKQNELALSLAAQLFLYEQNEKNKQKLLEETQQKQLAAVSQASEFALEISQAFSDSLEDQQLDTKKFLKGIVNAALKVTEAQTIAIATASSLAQPDSVGTFGLTGLVRAAIITGLIKTAFSAARGIINQFEQGGIVPNGGGIIRGASHANGGVKFMSGGVLNEAQGGEPILVKEAGADPATRQVLSAINVAHGGRAFASGGITPSTKFASGGITPSFSTNSAVKNVLGFNAENIAAAFNQIVDAKISNLRVLNVASDTIAEATKVNNIQSEVNF